MGIPLSCFAFCSTVRILEFDARPERKDQESCRFSPLTIGSRMSTIVST